MKTCDLIYQSYLGGGNCDSNEDALNYAKGTLFSEYEFTEEEHMDFRFIDSINGVDVYYQYGADYYFFVRPES